MAASIPIAPGAHIELRDAVWRVRQVDFTSTGTQAWRCVGVSEIVRDQEAIFLQEYEPQVRVLDPRRTRLERDTSSQHRAGLLYIESLLRDVPPPDDGLYVGHRAAMDLLDFQLEPAWMALSRPRQRILIADAVGLGKTLEAGILLAELIRRGRGRRILVAATKSMLTQLQKELWARFSIPLVRLDSIGLARIRAQIPSHHNPFYYFDKTIISIDTLKQNNWFRTHVENAHWDVIIIDEAHNVASRGSRDSQRAGIAGKLARCCDSLILLSATPHDGKAESFASLMNMLDPTAIANPSRYTKDDIKGLYVRRFKHDVKDQLAAHIPERTVMEAHATASAEEEAAFELLTELELPTLDQGATGGILFRTGLTKAIFSSPAACLAQLRSPLRRKRISDAIPDDARRQLLDQTAVTTSQALERAAGYLPHDPVAADLLALSELARAIEAITPDSFSRYQKLLETLERTGWSSRKAREDRLVIFTERRETLSFLAGRLSADLGLKPGQWQVLHGGLSDIDQQLIVEEFGKTSAPTRVLLASDVASEGLNLHYLCHRLVHFDMPWSLMVFQQRNGRIDRYGQKLPPQIVYLQTDSDNEVIQGDTRILTLLREKSDQAYENIGDPSAFMGVFDVEEEEAITARAMQAGESAEELSSKLDANLVDPFALLLDDAAAADLPSVPPTLTPPSLFASDFDYFATGIARLQDLTDIEATMDADEQLIELRLPEDLKRRFGKLPAEVWPEDGVALLTADPERMQRALDEARREEDAWPRHQLLWANSPVLHWLSDRVRSAFARHTAPILVVPRLGDGESTAIIVSGLLPNRRGQPLVQRWYVARFTADELTGVETLEELLAATGLGGTPLPNTGEPVDEMRLAGLLAPAIAAVESRVLADRDRFRAESGPRLAGELDRLARLQDAQMDFIDQLFEDRRDARAFDRRTQQERHVRNLFTEYKEWIRDAMTTADEPFLQVVAVLVGESR
jgi:superfamily II DNA or RNA helicase